MNHRELAVLDAVNIASLVEKIDSRRWHLTEAGCGVLGA